MIDEKRLFIEMFVYGYITLKKAERENKGKKYHMWNFARDKKEAEKLAIQKWEAHEYGKKLW